MIGEPNRRTLHSYAAQGYFCWVIVVVVQAPFEFNKWFFNQKCVVYFSSWNQSNTLFWQGFLYRIQQMKFFQGASELFVSIHTCVDGDGQETFDGVRWGKCTPLGRFLEWPHQILWPTVYSQLFPPSFWRNYPMSNTTLVNIIRQ